MFSHHESAQAKVLYSEDVFGAWEDEHHIKVELVLEVYPAGGQPFRAKAAHHFPIFTPKPEVGDMVYVKYDPKSLKVELNVHGDNRYGYEGQKHKQQAQRQAEIDKRDALLSAQPGMPVSPAASMGGAGMAGLDPELQELMRLEEAERQAAQGGGQQMPTFKQIMDARGTHIPPGSPGAAPQSHPQGAMEWASARALHGELMHTGVSGQAKILRKQRTGEPIHHHTPFWVEVMVQPANMGYPFQCSFTAWVDTNKEELKEGHTLPVKYDPQNTSRMVFDLPS